jgi:L-fuculose-phosphate aldolase
MDAIGYAEQRGAVVEVGRRLAERGLVTGTSGNLSMRVGQVVVATPAGSDLQSLSASELSVIDLDGARLAGPRPTSEVPLHLAVYRSTPATAIAHTHAVASTAISCVYDELPALHYNVVRLGGPPRTARYATFGTEALAVNVVEAMSGGRCAALMQNHGSIAWGSTMSEACERLELLEWLCELQLAAARLGESDRPARVLSEAELADAAAAMFR